MSKKPRISLLVFILTLMLIISTTSNAASVLSTSSTGQSFVDSWERYASGDSGNAYLTYGFNTFLINEDYSWAKHNTDSHYAGVSNNNGIFTGPAKAAGSTSKIEVRHSGLLIKYYNYYY